MLNSIRFGCYHSTTFGRSPIRLFTYSSRGLKKKSLMGATVVLDEYKPLRIQLENEQEAKIFFKSLGKRERKLLREYLTVQPIQEEEDSNGEVSTSLTSEERLSLFLVNFLPFVGFGILDNMIMIIAGEYIDVQLGSVFMISTMAAAGFGNIISDVAGVGLAGYVESLVNKLGFHTPALSPQQWNTLPARLASKGGMAMGLVIGCLIGMFPLLFFENDKKDTAKTKSS